MTGAESTGDSPTGNQSGDLTHAAESAHYADGEFTTCPDCGGELAYLSKGSLACRDCGSGFGHHYTYGGRNRLTRALDHDVVAVVYDPTDDARPADQRDDVPVADGGHEQIPLAEAGLWIPPDCRTFDQQIVIRTPRATIQHFGDFPLDPHYGLVDRSHFGDVDDPRNPDLAPDRVTITPQGEDTRTFAVGLDPAAADGDPPGDPAHPPGGDWP